MDQLQYHVETKFSPAGRTVYSTTQILQIFFKIVLFSLRVMFAIFVDMLTFISNLVIPKKPKSIAGQLALVTGGANGLGRETARALAKQKCNIVICDLNLQDARITAKEIECEFGVTTKVYKTDVSDFKAIELLKKNIEADIGYVDILVNNAGVVPLMSLREGKYHDYQTVMNVNVMSHLFVSSPL